MSIYLSPASKKNLNTSIRKSVPIKLLKKYLSFDELQSILESSDDKIHCWAMTKGLQSAYNSMEIGDWVIFSESKTGKFTDFGIVSYKLCNINLGKALWPVSGSKPWENIYFLKKIQKIDISKSDFILKLGYNINFNVPGQIRIDRTKEYDFIQKNGPFDRYLQVDLHESIDDIEDSEIIKIFESEPIETNDNPLPRTNQRVMGNRSYWETKPGISKSALISAEFICEVDSSHNTFTSRVTNNKYVEAHHLIPMKFQNEFQNSLDHKSNIISVCPNCHRLLHHSIIKEKKEILSKLFNNRKEALDKGGISITEKKLMSYYGI